MTLKSTHISMNEILCILIKYNYCLYNIEKCSAIYIKTTLDNLQYSIVIAFLFTWPLSLLLTSMETIV